MTIIHSPPAPPAHPTDLVVDAFGAFLGKRSERLVVRWRNERERESLADDHQTGRTPLAIRFPPIPTNETAISPRPVETANTAGPGNTTPAESSADDASAELLKLWRGSHSPPRRSAPSLGTSSTFGNRLADLSDNPHDGPDSRGWSERLVPLSRLRSVMVSGRGVTVSSDLIGALVERGITLSFLSGRGQPLATLTAPGLAGTVQTRRSQLAAYTLPLGVQLAVEFIRGKLRNQKHQLQYSGKYLKMSFPERFQKLEKKIAAIAAIRHNLVNFDETVLEKARDRLMGFEGTGARLYWEGVSIILEGRTEFPGRQTQGATDPINSALNYGYGILYSQVSGALANAGLELFAGFLHVDRPGKPSLVLDMVEEFRAPIVDRAVLSIVNQGITLETDHHGLIAASRRLVADRVLERLGTEVPYEGKRWKLSSVIQHQARHLAVAVRGERIYKCFASRW